MTTREESDRRIREILLDLIEHSRHNGIEENLLIDEALARYKDKYGEDIVI